MIKRPFTLGMRLSKEEVKLFEKVAEMLDRKPSSVIRYLAKNSAKEILKEADVSNQNLSEDEDGI